MTNLCASSCQFILPYILPAFSLSHPSRMFPMLILHQKNDTMNTTSKNIQRGKTTTGKKTNWDKPISRAFYEKLRAKIKGIITTLGYVSGYTDEMMKMIDRYLVSGELPTRYYCEEYIMALFSALRYDVDEAVRRSAAARQRAAERRARKEAQIASEDKEYDKEKVEEKANPTTAKADGQAMRGGRVTAVHCGDAPARGVPKPCAPSSQADASRSARLPNGARG